mgnify:FL=1
MKKLTVLFMSFMFLVSCETISSIKKPELSKPFSKCPPKGERTLKDILCRE